MSPLELFMMILGWIGMVLILAGMKLAKSREVRQIIMSSGAALLAAMAAYPEVKPVFFSLQIAVALVGFINVRAGNELLKILIIGVGTAIGCGFAIAESVGVDTWFGIAGLVGIAIGYAATPESKGGNQYLWMGIGAVGMVGYSTFGVFAGVWQAWPFLVLNIPFGYWGFIGSYRMRRERVAVA